MTVDASSIAADLQSKRRRGELASMPRLPPLNAIRAFEAAARHVSFSKAAEELHVTRAAISRQVALLESWLDCKLFVRSPSQLTLSAAGKNYLVEVSAALNRLALASRSLMEQPSATTLRLNAPPTFTMRWLITRMSTFQRRYPDVELRMNTYRSPATFRDDEYDVAIRGASEPMRGYASIPFIAETVIPICHPDLVPADTLLRPRDLSRFTLINYSTEMYTWPQWLKAVGHDDLKPGGVLKFDPMYFALQAAMEGLGIVLVPLFLVIDDLIAERLVAPFGMLGVSRRHYYVNYAPGSPLVDGINVFCNWLLREGSDTDQSILAWAASKGW